MDRTNQEASTSATPKVVEYSIRTPKDSGMTVQLMTFAKHLNFNFQDVCKAQLWYADDAQELRKEAQPQFGAGSQFRKQTKLPPKTRTSKPKNHSLTFKTKMRNGEMKKYISMREGGPTERSVYYVMVKGDRGFEAYPLEEWHTFRPAPMKNSKSLKEVEDLLKNRSQGMHKLENKLKSVKSSANDKINDSSDDFSLDDESDKETNGKQNKFRRQNNNFNNGAAQGSDNEDLEENEVDYSAESELESDGEENQSEADKEAEEKPEVNDVDSESESDDDFVECSENEYDDEEPLQTGRKQKAKQNSSDRQRPRKKFP